MTLPALEARGVTKHYGHVLALDGADFSAFPGEVVALIGDNGAGKSTLVKTLVGAIRPDRGEILVDGEAVQLTSPLDARGTGSRPSTRIWPWRPTWTPRPTCTWAGRST